jgi:Ca2+-binding EF-hand superfamily protein
MRDEAALRAKFEAFDTDGNGHIGQTQFKTLIRKLGLKLSETKATNAFLALDVKGTGRVEYADFSVWWFKYDRP